MSSAIPKTFWGSPIRYLRWASHEKPAIFYSVIIGCLGPIAVFTLPSVRRYMGDAPPPRVPRTYPVPSGPRKTLDGYDD